jgi:hypothetical protein
MCLHFTAGRVLKVMFVCTNQGDGGTSVKMTFVVYSSPGVFGARDGRE